MGRTGRNWAASQCAFKCIYFTTCHTLPITSTLHIITEGGGLWLIMALNPADMKISNLVRTKPQKIYRLAQITLYIHKTNCQ